MILAVSVQDGFDSIGVLKLLAIAGGAGLGGLIVGLLSQLLSRALTTQKLPPKLLLGSRLGGAGIGGWLIALWVFGGGGPGIGGGGGFGVGPGEGTGPDKASPSVTRDASSDEPEPIPPAGGGSGGEVLRVEVLGRETLVKITGKPDPDRDRCYRVQDKDGAKLLSLAELKKRIQEQRKQSPPLRELEIILYNDSPARDVPYVRELDHWARDLPETNGKRLKVDTSGRDENAPLR